jgi:DNA-binding transcriptional MerR regulator
MVNKEIVLDTIKKMYESGIEDDVVAQTLTDIGLNGAEIRAYIAEAKGVPAEDVPVPERKPFEGRVAAVREEPNHVALHTTTHVALEEQAGVSERMLKKIEGIESRLASQKGQFSAESLAEVNQRMAEMEKQLRELKAELSAAKSILEKILETDRSVLTKL